MLRIKKSFNLYLIVVYTNTTRTLWRVPEPTDNNNDGYAYSPQKISDLCVIVLVTRHPKGNAPVESVAVVQHFDREVRCGKRFSMHLGN